MSFVTRGFRGRGRSEEAPPERVPPGQYATGDFPVLSAGPTPSISLDEWRFTLVDTVGSERSWSWTDLMAVPSETVTVDIHCVTKWSKLGTTWTGVPVDALLGEIGHLGSHALFRSYGGYTTNLPVADVTGGRAWIAFEYEGRPRDPAHGGPARLLVPHVYLWKSAKWVNGVTLSDVDRPGFWESYGYHNYGDPWQEQRYAGD
jgi:DMSO/TMAO reductase YedYZ molybdopterin-dependent catalytic subunit